MGEVDMSARLQARLQDSSRIPQQRSQLIGMALVSDGGLQWQCPLSVQLSQRGREGSSRYRENVYNAF